MRKLSHANDKWVMVSLLGIFFPPFFLFIVFFFLLHTHIVRQWILSVFLWSNNWWSTCQKKKQMLTFHATTFYVLLCSAAFSLPDEFVPITLLCSWPILTRVLAFVRLIPISWITFSRVTSSFIWFCSNSTTSDEKLASSQRSFVLPCIKLVNLWYIGKSLDSKSFIRSKNMHA